MKIQALILTLSCTLLPLISDSHGTEKETVSILGSGSDSSPLKLREEIPGDVVLMPLTSLARAKAASLETYHEEKRDNPEKILLESLRTHEEEENLRRALHLSLVSEDGALDPREIEELETAKRLSLSTLPVNSLLASSATEPIFPTEKKDIFREDEDDYDVNRAIRYSRIDEKYDQRTRALENLREQSQIIAATRDSLWEQGQAISATRESLWEQGQAISATRESLREQGQAISATRASLLEEELAIDKRIMDIVLGKESAENSESPSVRGGGDNGVISSIPQIPSHALPSLPLVNVSSLVATAEDSQVNTNAAPIKKNQSDEM